MNIKNSPARILFSEEGKRFLVRDVNSDFHCQFGFVKALALKKAKPGSIVKTNTGKALAVMDAGFIDLYRKLSRAPQIIILKDIGTIIAETGINSKSRVVDGGAGSGALAIFLANIADEVTTYEIRKDFIKVVKRNIQQLGIKNLRIRRADIIKGIKEKGVDLVTLDIPEPWRALKAVLKALKPGGFLVCYLPNLNQVSEFAKAVDQDKAFLRLKTIETIEREWEIDSKRLRPKSQPIGHSGFLTFVRKIGK